MDVSYENSNSTKGIQCGGYMASTVIEFLRADEYLWKRVLLVGFTGTYWTGEGHKSFKVNSEVMTIAKWAPSV